MRKRRDTLKNPEQALRIFRMRASLAGVVVVLLSRVLLTLALFLLAERVSGSAYAAGLVVLLYTASPQWYFFNAQFSYQTLALALAVAVLWLVARTCDAPAEGARAVVVRRAAAAQAVVALLVVTHDHSLLGRFDRIVSLEDLLELAS